MEKAIPVAAFLLDYIVSSSSARRSATCLALGGAACSRTLEVRQHFPTLIHDPRT